MTFELIRYKERAVSCPSGDPYMARLYLIPSDNFILTGAEKKDSCYVFREKTYKEKKCTKCGQTRWEKMIEISSAGRMTTGLLVLLLNHLHIHVEQLFGHHAHRNIRVVGLGDDGAFRYVA